MTNVRALSGPLLLEAWERCGAEPPLGRALALLQLAMPGAGRDELAALDLRARDRLLLELRCRSFGMELEGRLRCPSCAQWLEFALDGAALAEHLAEPLVAATLSADGYETRLRLASSADLARAAALSEPAAAEALLLDRCAEVFAADGARAALGSLSAEARADVARRLDALHEAAEISIALVCAACGAAHSEALDIESFLSIEVRQGARQMLEDIHELAWAYGWSEQDILAMSQRRRQAYLEMVWQ